MLSDESKCGRDELDREERMYLPQSMELCQRLNTFKNEKKILTREIISFFFKVRMFARLLFSQSFQNLFERFSLAPIFTVK